MEKACQVFIVGGVGWLGSKITHELLEKSDDFKVKLLVRRSSWEKKREMIESFQKRGAEIVEGDVQDLQGLTEAMKGSDTVISVLGDEVILYSDDQFNVLTAAEEAGVRRFIPSEFGIDIEDENDFLLGRKVKLRHHLMKSKLEYTLVICGGFYEYSFGLPTGFDIEAKRPIAYLPGDGNQMFSAIHYADVAKYLPEILKDPTAKNRKVYVFGQNITHNEAVEIFQEVFHKKMRVVYQSCEELRRNAEDENIPMEVRISAHLKRILVTINEVFDDSDVVRYPVKPMKVMEYAKQLKLKLSEEKINEE